MDERDLLRELHIERSQREGYDLKPWRWPRLLGGGFIVLIVLAGTAWFFLARRSLPVRTALATPTASSENAAAVLQATGYVTARRQATVSAQITGTLTQVLIEEGDHVKKGQVLARLEDQAQRASLNAAEANAAAAKAQVMQDRAQLMQAERDMRRQNDLDHRRLVSKQAAEQARTQVAVARAELNAQRKRVTAAEAQVAVARVQFGYTVVRAPFAGVITAKAAQVGEIVSPLSAGGGFTRTGVGTIVDMNSLEVDVDVNESYIGRVKPGMPTQTVLDAYPDWTIPGRVIAIVPSADRGKATVPVRVALDTHDDRIVPNMGARVSFLQSRPRAGKRAAPGVLVPASAVVIRDGHATVFVIDGDVARARRINPASGGQGDLKRIPSGLEAGTEVVVKPPKALTNGRHIRVRNKAS